MGVSRLRFLTASGAAATASLVACGPQNGTTNEPPASPPSVTVGKARTFRVGNPVAFQYPDAQAPALAVKLGQKIDGGVGPDGDIVAYSQLCTHRGCAVQYKPSSKTFLCPCHYTVFDCERQGEVVIGHATTNLPRINLAYDASSDDVTATAVQGLIYGRFENGKLG